MSVYTSDEWLVIQFSKYNSINICLTMNFLLFMDTHFMVYQNVTTPEQ